MYDVGNLKGFLEKLLIHVSKEIKAGKSKDEVMALTSIDGVTDMLRN